MADGGIVAESPCGCTYADGGYVGKVKEEKGLSQGASAEDVVQATKDPKSTTEVNANRAANEQSIRKSERSKYTSRYADGGAVIPPGFEPMEDQGGEPAQANPSALPPGFEPMQDTSGSAPAIPAGFEPVEDAYGTPGEQLKTYAEGVGEGALGPIAPAAERLFGVDPQAMQLRQETNPWTHAAGVGTGLVGSSAAGVGLGAGLAKVGEAASALAGGSEVASAAGRIANAALQGAAENAVFQGQDEVSKLIKQDPNQSAETAMANIGLASVLGAGAGAAFGTVPELWKAAEGTKVAQGISDFANQMKNRLAGIDPKSALSEELLAHRTAMANADDAASQAIASNTESLANRPAQYQKAAEKLKSARDDFAPARDAFDRNFAMDDGTAAIDPDKIDTHLTGKNKKSSAALQDYLDASKKYQKSISDVHDTLGLEAPEFSSPTNNMQASLGKESPGAKLANYVFNKGVGNLSGEAIGAVAGHSTGVPYGGTIGALLGKQVLGPKLNSIIHSLAEPFVKQAVNSSAAKTATDYAIAVANGETGLNRAVGHVFKAGQMELPNALLPAGESDKTKLNQKLESLQTNPEQLMNTGGNLGHYMPEHSAAMASSATNTVNYLNNLRPNSSTKAPLDTKLPPDPARQAAYNRALGIAQKPLSVLGHIKTGRLTSQDVQAFQAMYPALHSRVSQKLVSEMANHMSKGGTVPYQTRIALSRFMGQPMDSTLSPQAVFAAQPMPPMNQPATPTTPASNPKRSTSKLDGIAKAAQTQSQARTARSDGA